MSGRVTGRAVKNIFAISSVLLGTTALAGCSTLGLGGGLPYAKGNGAISGGEIITGAIGDTAQGNLLQPMPAELGSGQKSSGPYLPPANVGAGTNPNLGVATVSSLPPLATSSQNNSTIVTARAVPAVPSSSNVGVKQAMPAQPRTSSLFKDSSVPKPDANKSGASQPAPQLRVIEQTQFQHTIEAGESLYAIARRYGVTTDAIAKVNNISSPDQISVGQKLIIPGRADLLAARSAQTSNKAPAAAPVKPAVQTTAKPTSAATPVAPVRQQVASVPANNAPLAMSGAGNYRWPVNGRVIIDFEASRRTGINIEAPGGAPVGSAENGTVIYVGNGVEGYGNLVLVRHPNGYVTAYAHLKAISVQKDQVVRRGQKLGTVGMTGSVNRPQLHFELRQGATP
ncbi:hypothetical protein MNBD_ALPHA12-1862, partial [hydrothermal vent metagenome]